MRNKADRSAALLRLLRGPKGKAPGLRIVTVKTAAPNPITLVFEGTAKALDVDIFEVPGDYLPLAVGHRFFTLPITGGGEAPRWGLIQKL